MTTLPTTTGITVRRAADRGTTDFGWLDSRHTFSFGRYVDRDWVSFGPLRVINDDRIAGGGGFGTHPHDNMEIISYVVSGGLAHKDSTGTASTIPAGGMQRMTAGTGVTHSEFNPSKAEPARFLQIWIVPAERDLEPSYEERTDVYAGRTGALVPLVTPDGRDGSMRIHQDASILGARLGAGDAVAHTPGDARRTWVQVVKGDLTVNGVAVGEGDGVAADAGLALQFATREGAEVLVFDVA
jgi:redox-sensitive bicupin YhaK (pirin superfamily)